MADAPHPFLPLAPDEIREAARLARTADGADGCRFIAIGLDQHAVRTLRYRKKRIRLRSHD
jgi:hypothetical protein